MRVRTMAVAVVGLIAASACATGGGGAADAPDAPEDTSRPQVCLDIDNRQGAGGMERLFLVGLNSNQRIRIGDAPVGRVTRFCTRSAVIPGSYYVLVERPSSDNIDPALNQNSARAQRTRDFVMEPGDLWIWDVRRIRFTCQPGGAGGGDC